MSEQGEQRVRLDKWLWAARFFKTRALAKAAIDGGKVHCRGERCKPGLPRVCMSMRPGRPAPPRCGCGAPGRTGIP